ncbi:MAG: M64 family metallopeptidase [Bdellovibrionota bacterium]
MTISKILSGFIFTIGIFGSQYSHSNPYFDESQVPKDFTYPAIQPLPKITNPLVIKNGPEVGLNILRVGVKVDLSTETYSLANVVTETSGTPAYYRRAHQFPKWGSYRAVLRDPTMGMAIYHDSIGTGKEFRKLVNEITFRFPLPLHPVRFELTAENPETGKMELVFSEVLDPASAVKAKPDFDSTEIRELKRPTTPGASVRVNIYADGYTSDRKDIFWLDAAKAVSSLIDNKFPLSDRMHFYAVFSPSQMKLGKAVDLGLPVAERNSFLGLYYPYWDNFGRWFNIVYPTREDKFRRGLALAPYDYAIILIDNNEYWGVGNFRELTSIPARSMSFTYLLLHEAGHFFGLNEEYSEGGRTELEFAPGIDEPWSQNITFLKSNILADLKWASFVLPSTPLPTPKSYWPLQSKSYGAFAGGYAQSPPLGHSHIPGLNCVMDRGSNFCDVCRHGITEVINFDLADQKN